MFSEDQSYPWRARSKHGSTSVVSGHQKLPCPLMANRSVVAMNALRDRSSRSDEPDARRECAGVMLFVGCDRLRHALFDSHRTGRRRPSTDLGANRGNCLRLVEIRGAQIRTTDDKHAPNRRSARAGAPEVLVCHDHVRAS